MELVGPAGGKKQESEAVDAQHEAFFMNVKQLPPHLANICQITTTGTMLHVDFGYVSPIEINRAEQFGSHRIEVVVQDRILLEPAVARQLRDLLDEALQSLAK